jgi:hypothetical protein
MILEMCLLYQNKYIQQLLLHPKRSHFDFGGYFEQGKSTAEQY